MNTTDYNNQWKQQQTTTTPTPKHAQRQAAAHTQRQGLYAAGRPRLGDELQRKRNVTLSDTIIAYARTRSHNGENASEGLRLIVQAAMARDSSTNPTNDSEQSA